MENIVKTLILFKDIKDYQIMRKTELEYYTGCHNNVPFHFVLATMIIHLKRNILLTTGLPGVCSPLGRGAAGKYHFRGCIFGKTGVSG